MRRAEKWLFAGVALVGLVCLAWLIVAGVLLWAVLDPADWATVTEALGGRAGLLIFLWALALVPVTGTLRFLIARYITAPARLAEAARLRLDNPVDEPLKVDGSRETQQLADIFNTLITRHREFQEATDERVAEAGRRIELERGRLAALMSELRKSVIVCNLDGRILLYNNRARQQFRRLSGAAEVTGGAELMGLGRSIYTVLDRRLVAHALDTVRRRLESGAESPGAQFVTATPGGKLLRVQVTPVSEVGDGEASPTRMAGFVLLTENITDDMQADAEKDRLLQSLTEGSRSALANTRAAIEILADDEVDEALRDRLLGVIHEEVTSLSERIDELSASSTERLRSRWPLEEMLGSELVDAAVRHLAEEGEIRVAHEGNGEEIWLKVDSFSILQALAHLAGRITDEHSAGSVSLRLVRHGKRAALDLLWQARGEGPSDPAWENEPMQAGNEQLSMSVNDVMERHGGTCWHESTNGEKHCFRLLLPVAEPVERGTGALAGDRESRPEYYDFDLFATTPETHSLDDAELGRLTFTVFDTETTGLDPTHDEIIQIGAVRIVNGRLLRHEFFEQLVNPGRSVPAASTAIHGITPEMVRGQPDLETVLPAFHAFCQDTVLVAHNAAFDMRCLQVAENRTGVVFDQPVLDTLLLSALVHEHQAEHNLEALAQRFGLAIVGRHTAIGDAMVTAEIFVRLIPLLAEQGIHTLGQARSAAQKTQFARMRY
ncbi:DNA polymerase III subunit epsilon [Wenzhouxiangella sp. AB-CW3]|uniref:3'-5' exonuclease n=1 Tax=Wenzhouxiangella sp. AB-CW3 TaxID=2771012 RepID=UPI00168BFA90|nr:exonuclease domain-containing protein [Wenzhouxiangella sp. AB-CW3]QOC22130.1 DNA polymerase III subunit epsilon [Wenzhouxiangella sp. AB-CW3]